MISIEFTNPTLGVMMVEFTRLYEEEYSRMCAEEDAEYSCAEFAYRYLSWFQDYCKANYGINVIDNV